MCCERFLEVACGQFWGLSVTIVASKENDQRGKCVGEGKAVYLIYIHGVRNRCRVTVGLLNLSFEMLLYGTICTERDSANLPALARLDAY